MNFFKKIIFTVFIAFSFQNAFAGFPQDFSDVVWPAGTDISGWAETSELRITSIDGSYIYMPHSKTNVWPISCRLGSQNRLNANVWGFVKLGGVWHAGTFEYLRVGYTTRKTYTFGGSSGGRAYFRPPINTFTPQNGELYAFMVAGISRDSFDCNNVRERSNVVLWRWGVGEVAIEEPEPEPEPEPVVSPALNSLLLN